MLKRHQLRHFYALIQYPLLSTLVNSIPVKCCVKFTNKEHGYNLKFEDKCHTAQISAVIVIGKLGVKKHLSDPRVFGFVRPPNNIK
jgi:hypothetical protein